MFYFYSYQYNAFRAKKREVGYSEEDLKETYGFLLFDDASKVQFSYTATPEKINVPAILPVLMIVIFYLFKGSHTWRNWCAQWKQHMHNPGRSF